MSEGSRNNELMYCAPSYPPFASFAKKKATLAERPLFRPLEYGSLAVTWLAFLLSLSLLQSTRLFVVIGH